ncbi:MAG: hypothetical protein ACI4UE_02245 [Candidatus Scatovivens sp.]
MKRTNSQIERDYRIWRKLLLSDESITTWRDLASKVGATQTEVSTSFKKHPSSFKKFQKLLDERRSKSSPKQEEPKDETIVIPDVPSLLYSLQYVKKYRRVYIPSAVFGKIFSKAKSPYDERHMEAKKALEAISNKDWAVVLDKDFEKASAQLITEPFEEVHNDLIQKNSYYLSRSVVALACYYWSNTGSDIIILSRTRDIRTLAELQGLDTVHVFFPDSDEFDKKKKTVNNLRLFNVAKAASDF